MKKLAILFLCSLFLTKSYAQITRGNWMVGGSARFSKQQEKLLGSDINSFKTDVSPNLGYFFADKIAGGLKPDFGFIRFNTNGIIQKSATFGIGPFVRYYLFPTDNRTNLLIESDYQYSFGKNGYAQNLYDFSAGPVIFFNASVGLECTLNYEILHSNGASISAKTFFFNIGFQIHLEKEANP